MSIFFSYDNHVIVGLGIFSVSTCIFNMGMFFGLQQAQNGELATESKSIQFPFLGHTKELFSLPIDGLVVPGTWKPSACG